MYTACGLPEAEIIRGKLAAEGITSILKYESLGMVYGLTLDGLGQVKVLVPEQEAEMARIVLAEKHTETENEID